MEKLEKHFSLDFDVFTVVTHELRLATYNEMQTVYDTSDLYDMLEMIDAHITLLEYAEEKNRNK